MSCDVGEATEQSSFSNLSVTSPMSQLILQPFLHFTYITCHSPTLLLLHVRHSSFSNSSFAFPTSQALHLHHLVSHPCFCPMSLTCMVLVLILQPFCHFTYITAHSPTLLSLYLHHSSFSNPSVISPTSQLILQPFRHFTYVTAHSPTLLSLLIRLRIFTYVTWRATHALPSRPTICAVLCLN